MRTQDGVFRGLLCGALFACLTKSPGQTWGTFVGTRLRIETTSVPDAMSAAWALAAALGGLGLCRRLLE